VSEIMLQQTQVATVIPYYDRWMRALPTVASLAHVSSPRLHKLWEGLGYYRRVRHLQDAARVICANHDGRFPERFEDVLALPGVGRYTAGAICSIAFNQPTPIVDGNVIRVLTRLFGITDDPHETRTRERLWQLAEALVKEALEKSEIRNSKPERNSKSESRMERPQASSQQLRSSALRASFGVRSLGIGTNRRQSPDAGPACSHLNQSLMELGATVCTPRDPACEVCPVAGLCVARRRGVVATLPRAKARPEVIERYKHAFVLERQGRFLAIRNDGERVNGLLWEFPSVQVSSPAASAKGSGRRAVGLNGIAWQRAEEVRHSITRYRIRMRVFRGRVHDSLAPALPGGRWLSRADLQRLPFSAAHRRVADALLAEQGTKSGRRGRQRSQGTKRPLARPRSRA
jgi:A/G-specific adenine glycosylase